MPESPYIGVVPFAAQVGMTSQYIRRLIKQGKITKSSLKTKGKRKLIDPEKALIDIENNISHVSRRSPKAKPIGLVSEPQATQAKSEPEKKATIISAAGLSNATLSEAQTIKERYAAALKKLEYEKNSNKLVKVSDIQKEAFTMARLTRDSILSVVDRVSAVLAAETDEKVVADILRDELLQALELLAAG